MQMLNITPEMLARVPKLYSGENEAGADKVAHLKIFDPCGRFTLYVTEAGEEEGDTLFFGFVVSALGADCDEWGYSSLNELKGVKNRFGLPLERDMFFQPTKMSEIFAKIGI